MTRVTVTIGLIIGAVLTWPHETLAWPLDGYTETGIRRLEEYRLKSEGALPGKPPLPGALLATSAVDLRLTDFPDLQLPPVDAQFTTAIRQLLGEHEHAYAIAVLDLTDAETPSYAEWRGDYRQNVGSVGKLFAALGFFQALADAYPEDIRARTRILRDTTVTADGFSQSDHHTVHMFDVARRQLIRRSIAIGDQASMWEWLDWTLSVSSNSAAAMIMREAMMLRAVGRDYPLADSEVIGFFSAMSDTDKTRLFQRTFWEPVTRNGMRLEEVRQGSFFTHGGKQRVRGGGKSYATVRSLMQFALAMEKGQLVDEWTSRQLKRLLYLTERRIRYASSPALNDAAVYFKSGSLYKCKEEPGFKCGAYRGNVRNYMNSVAIIEEDLGGRRLHYVVTLISNVLRVNSAVEHQSLATRIHRLLKSRHAPVDVSMSETGR